MKIELDPCTLSHYQGVVIRTNQPELRTMNTMNPTTAAIRALDITAQDIIDHKNWTGLTLRELVEAGRISTFEGVLEFVKAPLDDAVDRAMTRILEVPNRKKPYLDYETEAYPLCVQVHSIRHEVVMLLGVS